MWSHITNFFDAASEACDEIWRTRLRSNFTLVALILGTAGLSMLVCAYHLEVMTSGFIEKNRVNISLQSLTALADPLGEKPQLKRHRFIPADAEALQQDSRAIEKVILHGDPRTNADFSARGNSCSGGLRGSDITTVGEEQDGELVWGRYFTPEEVENASQVVVINHALKNAVFGLDIFSGGKLKIDGKEFTVIGIEWPSGNRNPIALIPRTTLENNYLNIEWYLEVFIKPGKFKQAIRNANNILKARLGDPGTDFVTTGAISPEKYRLYGFAGTIGILMLISAGIAAANKAYIGVLERLDQFALRRALGATIRRTYFSVMLESVILCGLGSFLGGVLGWSVFTAFMAYFTELLFQLHKFKYHAPLLILAIVVVVTICIGVTSGLQAARTAARSEPAQLIGKRDIV